MLYVMDARSLLLLLPLATAVERGAFDTDGRIIAMSRGEDQHEKTFPITNWPIPCSTNET